MPSGLGAEAPELVATPLSYVGPGNASSKPGPTTAPPRLQLWVEHGGRVIAVAQPDEGQQGLSVQPTTSLSFPGGPRNPDFRNHKLPDKSALRGADRDAGTSAALVRKTLAPKYTAQICLCGGTDRRKRTDSFCTFHSDVAGLQSHPERQRDKERNKESGECG